MVRGLVYPSLVATSSTVRPGSSSNRWAYNSRATTNTMRGEGSPERANKRSQVRRPSCARSTMSDTVGASTGDVSVDSSAVRS